MAAPATQHSESNSPPHGSTRSHPCGHGADPGNAKPRQRDPARKEGPEHGHGAAVARPFPRSGRPAASATQESAGLPSDQTHRSLKRALGAAQRNSGPTTYTSSSVQTLKLTSVFGPKVWVSGTSAASRPCAISTRPIRGMLLRASKVYQ